MVVIVMMKCERLKGLHRSPVTYLFYMKIREVRMTEPKQILALPFSPRSLPVELFYLIGFFYKKLRIPYFITIALVLHGYLVTNNSHGYNILCHKQ
jgi:superfamily I DNA and RNA helicase